MSLEQNSCQQFEQSEEDTVCSYNNTTYEPECELSFGEDFITEDSISPKKRKIDKDGFLCPATPDIPLTSSQHGQQKHDAQEGSELEAESEYQEHYEAEDIHCEPSLQVIEPSLQGLSQFNEDPKDRSMMCMAELVQDLGQDSKMLHKQWAETFSESENFENLCPTRLDKMIEQAKQLEESLLKQKELLCNRLNVISHIIKASITEGPGGDN
ncbi:testis-expressed sequence 12 protein [Mytilus galloprovincialis]|uniref:Testis-expressed sequence 12 protein n=1 Tax=Mytilus galloprovincialis TaxID=29158 RepID=A0A8B6DQ50_MYTGA|nr:testis-expressed sequence 12 protein [Mytilus galloprovincialis]